MKIETVENGKHVAYTFPSKYCLEHFVKRYKAFIEDADAMIDRYDMYRKIGYDFSVSQRGNKIKWTYTYLAWYKNSGYKIITYRPQRTE